MGAERRRAARVSCRLPVRLKGQGNPCLATTLDLSRVGARIAVPRLELGLGAEADTQTIARTVNGRVGPISVADLHFQVLGALVRKGMRLVRIAVPMNEVLHIELGFEFRSPITDEEATFLGLDLPGMVNVPDDVASEPDPEAPLCVYLCPSGTTNEIVPLLAPVISWSENDLVLRVADRRRLPFVPEGRDLGGHFEAVTEAYGSRTQILVAHGVHPIWFGPAVVQAIDRPTADGGFDIWLGFQAEQGPGRRLRAWAQHGGSDPAIVEAVELAPAD